MTDSAPPVVHNSLTEQYLKEIGQRGVGAHELVDVALREVDLAATTFLGRCLTRPVFLSQAEHRELTADLDNLHAALLSLPRRLFGGDLAAFARAAGMTDPQVTAIMHAPAEVPTRMARGDLYFDGSNFRLMEFNMGSTVGGGDNARLNRAFLTHPVLAEFVEANQLSYVDSMAEIAHTLLTECGISAGDGSLVVAADWPASYATLEPTLRYSAQELAPFGIEMVPCHLGQLVVRDGRVRLDDRPVDVIYRVFMIEDLLDPTGPPLVDPILRAAGRGEVKIFTPIDSELYGSKAALAMLSDEANRHLFDAGELASLDRILPWTRMVRAGDVTVAGERVDLREYAAAQRAELILKPTALHAGQGVVLGWSVDDQTWAQRLDEAMDRAFVLQHRIRPVAELFPAAGGLEPWVLTWGSFLCANGYGGMFMRGTTDPDSGAVNMATGATGTSCFHQVG